MKYGTASRALQDPGSCAWADAYTPYSPTPSAGTLTLASGKKVELKAEGDALVTPPGPALFTQGDVDGTLIVQLDGVNKTIPLGVR